MRTSQATSKNPLNAFERECFGQTDEDGITLEILRRMGSQGAGVYAEVGVGDGLENERLVLAALAWTELWVGGEALKPRLGGNSGHRYACLQDGVTLGKLLALFVAGLKKVQATTSDVISLDLDGNDDQFVEALPKAHHATQLCIVEHNAKFPPPI